MQAIPPRIFPFLSWLKNQPPYPFSPFPLLCPKHHHPRILNCFSLPLSTLLFRDRQVRKRGILNSSSAIVTLDCCLITAILIDWSQQAWPRHSLYRNFHRRLCPRLVLSPSNIFQSLPRFSSHLYRQALSPSRWLTKRPVSLARSPGLSLRDLFFLL